jgi:2,5-diketo-D-gluconate reductase A
MKWRVPMTAQPQVTLNDGRTMPQFGLGVWQTPQDEAAMVVKTALEAGYRLIDTAAAYGNERGVGEGIRPSGVDPKDVSVTTKLWNDRQGFDSTLKAFDNSLGRLGVEVLDLYLITGRRRGRTSIWRVGAPWCGSRRKAASARSASPTLRRSTCSA